VYAALGLTVVTALMLPGPVDPRDRVGLDGIPWAAAGAGLLALLRLPRPGSMPG